MTVSRERARRRAARMAEADALRIARERTRRQSERRRAALSRLRLTGTGGTGGTGRTAGRSRSGGRTGRLFARRSAGQRAAIVTAGLGVLALTWLLIDSLAVRVGITVLMALTAPALVVLTFDRRI